MTANRTFWSAGTALAMILGAAPAFAETPPAANDAAADRAATDRTDTNQEVIVTGSRIQRLGFDAPTPTTVISETELRIGNRPSIAGVLNDMPQFRATSTPTTTTGNTTSGTSTADLRGLGNLRTLTLLDGHRFNGAADLNTVPQSLIKRVDVVTGGASAAWGSGAVAGVVNIILDDEMKGIRLGAQTGISTRGDGMRYNVEGAWGTDFAGGRGHFMIGGDYTDDQGILSRKSRPNLEAGVFQRADGQLIRAQDVNYTILNRGGSILGLTGVPRNLVFNPDGTVGPLPLGSQTAGQFTLGGTGQNIYDYVAVSSPYKRTNVFARATYDLTDSLKLWANGSFNRMTGDYGFFPETPLAVIMPDNAFLTPTARAQLAANGVAAPFILGRILDDVGPKKMLNFRFSRRNLEGAIGLKGKIGENWGYDVYYDHGEARIDQSLYNQRITSRFNNAVDSVLVNGKAVCRINAVTVTDPACAPIDLLGNGNISPEAVAYAFGANHFIYTTKLDAAGASVHGQPFSTPAGPVDIAFGTDWRWEKMITNFVDPLSQAGAFSTLNSSATNGAFSVKEAFGEVNVPVINMPDTLRLEVNGAARYSDYSTSGGIWTWKTGGTARIANDLLLRAVYSRDIRSPSITEYFLSRATNIGNLQDPFQGAPQANVIVYSGGNAKLTPETSHTLTLGGSYSPRFFKGFSVSLDYYSIDIRNVITTVTAQDALTQCYKAAPNDPTCGGIITRNTNGTIGSMLVLYRNLAAYKTRGLDIEASYRRPLGGGMVTMRAVANHIFDLNINGTDVAGIVGGDTAFSTPKWRLTGSVTYADDNFGVDLRARYVGGGIYSTVKGGNGQYILNNDVASRTYVDLGLQLKVQQQFTWFVNINNMFDVDPPLTPYNNPNYDIIGRYFSTGVKLKF